MPESGWSVKIGEEASDTGCRGSPGTLKQTRFAMHGADRGFGNRINRHPRIPAAFQRQFQGFFRVMIQEDPFMIHRQGLEDVHGPFRAFEFMGMRQMNNHREAQRLGHFQLPDKGAFFIWGDTIETDRLFTTRSKQPRFVLSRVVLFSWKSIRPKYTFRMLARLYLKIKKNKVQKKEREVRR